MASAVFNTAGEINTGLVRISQIKFGAMPPVTILSHDVKHIVPERLIAALSARATPAVSTKPTITDRFSAEKAVMKAEEEQRLRVFAKLEDKVLSRDRGVDKYHKIVFDRRGISKIVPIGWRKMRELKRIERNRIEKVAAGPWGPPTTTLSIGGGPTPSAEVEPPTTKWPLNKVPSQKKRNLKRQIVQLSSKAIDDLVVFITKTIKRTRGTLCITTKRTNNVTFPRKEGKPYACIKLKHMEGWRVMKDVHVDPYTSKILGIVTSKTQGWQPHHTSLIKRGWSGFILRSNILKGEISRSPDNLFIVRGKHEDKLYDARVRITRTMLSKITHFSSVGEKFWRGFDNTFLNTRVNNREHACSSDLDVQECGSVAAIMCLALFPCGKITCAKCVDENINEEGQANPTQLIDRVKLAQASIRNRYPQFKHAVSILDRYEKALTNVNQNYDAFSEIQSITDGRNNAAFAHVNKLNAILIKGASATSLEFITATNHLLEIARYMKNRTENIEKGSLSSFRNKISQKAHVNPTLMCDNQLDKNGNFIWGERGYHAKRFFNNYFEVIKPEDGYSKFETRITPNGTRKLAIGKLIVSTNFATLREQMQGEPVEKQPLTKECVSMMNGDYVHACCCVTNESGEPLLSDIRMPTKHHLVIGNSGDPKYVDLPDTSGGNMYIAKDGYCYMNIFLAMLVNVNESDAKAFTKMVRDVLVDKLGKWPSLLDVATACYLLKVFFPDVSNAELPRILVDHKTKTMHVVDSYGSISTGYHILKANTVEQLVKFTRHSLESDMKHYLVGGDPLSMEVTEEELVDPQYHLKLLIQSIYRPKMFLKHLIWNRYLPLYAMLSPGVLLALYNSGSLETLMSAYLQKDNDLVILLSMMESMAQKVSRARSVLHQIQIIENGAPQALEVLAGIKQRHVIPYNTALKMITVIAARAETNQTLNDAGYDQLRNTSVDIMEKKYLQMLQEEWNELSLSEKLSATYRSSKFAIFTRKHLRPERETDLGGRYSESITAHFGHAKQIAKNKCMIAKQMGEHVVATMRNGLIRSTCSIFNYMIPNILKYVNVLLVLSLLLTITREFQTIVNSYRKLRIENTALANEKNEWQLAFHHTLLTAKLKENPTLEEFKTYLEENAPSLLPLLNVSEHVVVHQAKRQSEQALEQIIAFIALLLMMVDPERSDCVTKILSKLKNLITTVDQDVYHQSLDEISDDLSEKNLTIDFEIGQDDQLVPMNPTEPTFSTWWAHQISKGFTIPHYRTEGFYMVFTRDTALQVANDIAHNQHRDILLMGAVGSGKSTGLPFHLAKKGSVLMVEPTRPLAENVHRQLAKEPFYMNTTLKMRGLTTFGSAPVTIMTSGFALNYFAHNRQRLSEFKFILFDECHVHDANAMALYCLIHENEYDGKILKVSATPPGREVEFKTQHAVSIATEDSISLQNFVAAQGSKSNCDVLKHGDNILVYVASYNEVDILSSLLNEKGYKVTKVDGRSMKVGSVEIITSGTSQRPHFVVATNIIENGVTLDIEVVVDFGTKVIPVLDSDNRLMSYRKVAINYGERIQRLGRVGRHKPGHALRIGHTERGLSEVPSSIATEAAFRCFTYGLPVIPNNVTTSILANATVRQARTMAQFELTPFYTVHFVRFDGTMHHAIHNILKRFKLRDSEIVLSKLAIPNKGLKNWMTCTEYSRIGANVEPDDNIRIPFMCKEVPEKLHFEIWDAITQHKADAGFGRLTSASACKIAYTLQTDVTSIQRTVRIIDTLIAEERRKQEYFRTVTANTVSSSNFSLQSIANAIRSRFSVDHTTENIGILECAKAQLCEFQNLSVDKSFTQMNSGIAQEFIKEFGALETVYHQSTHEVSKALQLKGRWNKTLITRDVIVLASVFAGGSWMLYKQFMEAMQNDVYHESKGKRQRQKLKFRNARDAKLGREVYGDDGDMEHFFGSAYTEKGKKSGRTRGMGTKQRKFVNMYAFDPEDFSAVRFVDPLTGATMDENPYTDVQLIQEYFGKIREQKMDSDELDYEQVRNQTTIHAYYMNNKSGKALKVDLTPHNPLKVCDKHVTIAGFPERAGELRQTGQPQTINISDVPKENEQDVSVTHESNSMFKGMRDYNPIASCVCKLTNLSDGHKNSLYGIGYGPLILTNRHLFERNNGEMIIKTHHGEFTIRNTTQLQVFPVPDRDLLLIKLPKDVPPFPQRFQFRQPEKSERVCLVGSNFQTRSITSLVSESSMTMPVNNSNFWKHWISTKDGHCGSPIVATSDGAILGLHSLANFSHSLNYFTSFPSDFKEKFLDTHENHEWVKHWKYNTSQISWGVLNIREAQPTGLFKTSKLVLDLDENAVYSQMERSHWLYDQLDGNLKAIAYCPSQLVTKHTVKGKCQMFDLYLKLHDEAQEFFSPLLGHYQKSRLNREAYAKDLLKYATPIEVGNIDYNCFEQVNEHIKRELTEIGFQTCNFITNEEDIFAALNMKSAVGALYSGKKKDFFADFTSEMKEQILRESCWRLFSGRMGVWNGSLKAELRPVEKVNANKTRTFTAAPIDTLLAGKVCVDDFNNQFYDFNLKAPWSVGMTKFYGGWDKLLSALPDGWVHCDADGSQFDSSLTPYLINSILDLRLHFMEDWELGHQMLRNLYTEIVYTPISTPDGTLVKKYKGNNSGQPSTVVDNTLMVMLAVRYSLLKSRIPLELQNQMSKFFVNGDDLLISVEPAYEYVLDDMQENFKQLGLKYTFDSRTRNKADLWFMSHKGLRREDLWIPKLEEERIVSILEWDRQKEPCHRLEAICAAMIESWGYDRLTHEIRKFYAWMLEQSPYSAFAAEGKAPYIAESALRKLYLDKEPENNEIIRYLDAIFEEFDNEDDTQYDVYHQSGTAELDAGRDNNQKKQDSKNKESTVVSRSADVDKPESSRVGQLNTDRDVNAGTTGTFSVPRLKGLASKMNLPKYKGSSALNLDHLLGYNPNQVDISNTRATHAQFNTWYEGVKEDYELLDDKMQIILNGLMVWCIENGTSPNINGMWVMMDGDEQVEFPIKPLIDHAKPTFRQIMAHFSNVAEAYIEKRNQDRPYMPRYGLQRNLTDMSLARYAFDFYEMTSKTPVRAREAHIQMKAAALRSAKNNLFGLDGNVGTTEENTERHTTEDVNQKMHSLLGVRGM